MTNTITIGICFLGMQALSIITFTFTTNTVHDPHEPNGCQPKLTITKETFIKFDVPNGVLIFLIAICYIIVMVRMKERQKQTIVLKQLTKTQLDRQNKAIMKMRKNVTTLTCLVLVSFFAILPRTIYGMYCQYSEESSPDVITITNNMLLINPLLDPFVYVFRIREFRDRLKCKCLQRNTIGSVTSENRDLRHSKQEYNSTETGMVYTTSNV
ncbi:ADOR [Mytilus edulis]|uniref:ADORA2A n=1 Tax=Mytilus edulis TaxID=6550 RepID=A0A8S3TZ26_MYTED|nr:ADOR [Mytilus edulis]